MTHTRISWRYEPWLWGHTWACARETGNRCHPRTSVALRAVLKDAGHFEVDRARHRGPCPVPLCPVEELKLPQGLHGIGMLRGNTDRYVFTGDTALSEENDTAADALIRENLPAFRLVRDESISQDELPASSSVQVSGLVMVGAWVEIDVLAVL